MLRILEIKRQAATGIRTRHSRLREQCATVAPRGIEETGNQNIETYKTFLTFLIENNANFHIIPVSVRPIRQLGLT